MQPGRSRPFRLSWVLRHELALGPAPRRDDHLQLLREEGCRSVLSLCQPGEQPHLEGLDQQFTWRSVPLPDHRCSEPLTQELLESALQTLEQLQRAGPVFVHCLAGRERYARVHGLVDARPGPEPAAGPGIREPGSSGHESPAAAPGAAWLMSLEPLSTAADWLCVLGFLSSLRAQAETTISLSSASRTGSPCVSLSVVYISCPESLS